MQMPWMYVRVHSINYLLKHLHVNEVAQYAVCQNKIVRTPRPRDNLLDVNELRLDVSRIKRR